MITRIVRVNIQEENRDLFTDYMRSFLIGVKVNEHNAHIDYFEDLDTPHCWHVYTIWKTPGALNKFLKSDLNLDFKSKLNQWAQSDYTAWTVENMFVPPAE